MMKKFFPFLCFLLFSYSDSVFAQGWVTDEATSDDSGGVFSGIFGLFLLLGLIWFIGNIMDKKSENDNFRGGHNVKKDTSSYNIKIHKDGLDREAEYVLGKAAHYGLSRNNYFLHEISWSECYREWFYQGYKDGKMNGEKQRVLRGDTNQKYETVSWEEYVDIMFSDIAKNQEQINKLCNGDITKARKAYVNGRSRGIRYRDKNLDGYMTIT